MTAPTFPIQPGEGFALVGGDASTCDILIPVTGDREEMGCMRFTFTEDEEDISVRVYMSKVRAKDLEGYTVIDAAEARRRATKLMERMSDGAEGAFDVWGDDE